MNLILAHCWREWRAQRFVLLSFLGLGCVCLTIVFTVVPADWWVDDGRGALALSWFVALGAFGVAGFAAPGLVTCEFGAKDDQFVRRLPGALRPAFAGKLLFLLLAALAMPLLGLLVGEGVLTALGRSWGDLWQVAWWEGELQPVLRWPWPVALGGAALLLAPWCWAFGSWLPRGRMALGAAILFAVLVGAGLVGVERQLPNVLAGQSPTAWLAFATVLGAGLAAWSWVRGRRGGGAVRSARFGAVALVTVLLVPLAWLGARAYRYCNPEANTAYLTHVHGSSADGRWLLASGAHDARWYGVPLRIDRDTGVAEQIGGFRDSFACRLGLPGAYLGSPTQLWLHRRVDATTEVFDLATGRSSGPLAYDRQRKQLVLPPDLQAALDEDQARTTQCRTADGLPVWRAGGKLWFREADGTLTALADPFDADAVVVAAGHGLRRLGSNAAVLYDLTRRRLVPALGGKGRDRVESGLAVRGIWLLTLATGARLRFDFADGSQEPLPELAGWQIVGLLDHDHVLLRSSGKGRLPLQVGSYRPSDRTVTTLLSHPTARDHVLLTELGGRDGGSLLPRDPAGRIWLRSGADTWFTVGPDQAVAERPAAWPRHHRFLQWLATDRALVLADGRLLEIDLASGLHSVRFPARAP